MVKRATEVPVAGGGLDLLSFNDLIGVVTITLSEILICHEAHVPCEWNLQSEAGEPSGAISLVDFADTGLEAFFDASTRSSIAAIRPKLAKLKSESKGRPASPRNPRRLQAVGSARGNPACENVEIELLASNETGVIKPTYENIAISVSKNTVASKSTGSAALNTYANIELPASEITAAEVEPKSSPTLNESPDHNPEGLAATMRVPTEAELLGDVVSIDVDTIYELAMPEFDWDPVAESGADIGGGSGRDGVGNDADELEPMQSLPIFVFEEDTPENEGAAWESSVI